MSIDQTKVVDFISTSPQGSVVLTISDHLVWDASNNHLLILQEKLNAYLSFIESEELLETYPDARGRDILISIHMKFSPVGDAIEFLKRTKSSQSTKILFCAPTMTEKWFFVTTTRSDQMYHSD